MATNAPGPTTIYQNIKRYMNSKIDQVDLTKFSKQFLTTTKRLNEDQIYDPKITLKLKVKPIIKI